jgi:hypothetical protein
MTHLYKNYLICRDDYLSKPEDVIAMANTLEFHKSTYFPGRRTGNLLAMEDPEIKKFADWFADRISYDVFPGISQYEIYVCFHINDVYKDSRFDKGWIHADYGNLAGLIYLTPGENNLNTGTSIFAGENVDPLSCGELPTDAEARLKFYLDETVTPEFVDGFERNRVLLEDLETIKIGNKFNRLIAYDSKMWHRPNSMSTTTGDPRLTLLFFISQFNYNQQTISTV